MTTIPDSVRAVRASARDGGAGGNWGTATHVHFAGSPAASTPVIMNEEASAAPALHAVAATAPDASNSCARGVR